MLRRVPSKQVHIGDAEILHRRPWCFGLWGRPQHERREATGEAVEALADDDDVLAVFTQTAIEAEADEADVALRFIGSSSGEAASCGRFATPRAARAA